MFKPLRLPVAVESHLSRGGRAYSQEVRKMVIEAPDAVGYVPGVTPHLTLGLVVGGIKDCRMKVFVGRSSDEETSAQTALLDRTSSC